MGPAVITHDTHNLEDPAPLSGTVSGTVVTDEEE